MDRRVGEGTCEEGQESDKSAIHPGVGKIGKNDPFETKEEKRLKEKTSFHMVISRNDYSDFYSKVSLS